MDEQFEENARQESLQMCPRKIDDCTVLDSVSYNIKTRTQNHYYTFSGELDKPELYTDYFIEDTRENMLKALRNEIKLKKQMEAGINFAYIYNSASTKKPLFTILFTKKDYTSPLVQRSFNTRITGKWQDYTLKNCPEKQDVNTVLDSVVYDSIEAKLYHNYTLSGELDLPDFNEQYPEATKQLKKMMIKSISENSAFTEENDSNVSYVIRYYSKTTGKKFIEINIKGDEIKKNNK